MKKRFLKATNQPTMTADSLAALNRVGLSRRDFLKTSGALIVGLRMLGPGSDPADAQVFQGESQNSAPANQVDSWIAIAADESVTAYSGKAEIGQGMSIAQTQLVAEELSVPLHRVTLVYCDTALAPDQGVTSGSQSHPTNFNHGNLAQAGATAREALFRLASARLGIPVDQLAVTDGVISANSDHSKRVSYGQLVGGKKFNLTLDSKATRKPASEWTVLGKPAKRSDMAAMVTGQFEFVHNVRLPGMLHGRVVRPSAVGATVVSVEESSVQDVPGLVKVVVKRIFVGNDCGPISNPDGLRNQIEGGALHGMSRALLEEVTWDDQKVTSFDWQTYRSLPLGFDIPKIESVLINRPNEKATGAGETSITVIAAAIGNAIFDATGACIRRIPFTPERVKAALGTHVS